jgi:hypothetical protein
MAPEAAADPIADGGAPLAAQELEADGADQHLPPFLLPGDGEVIGAAIQPLSDRVGNELVRDQPRIRKGHGLQHAADLPVIQQAMELFGIIGRDRPQRQTFGGEPKVWRGRGVSFGNFH